MPQRKGLLAPQNTFLDTIATRFDGTHSNFVLGNAQVHDYPIVYCSDGFVELTGYNRSQIMSKCCSCCFLWGEQTNDEAKQSILNTLKNKCELQIEIQFHKKTGEAFLCLLDIVPIKNDKSQVVLFLVSHKELSPNRHTRSKANCTVPESSLKVPYMLSAQHLTGTSPSNRTPNLLTMGLATTITAAVLGSTGFRSNKLLDYLSSRKNTTVETTTKDSISHNKLEKTTSIINRSFSDRGSVDSNKSQSRYSITSSNSATSGVINSTKPNVLMNMIDVECGPLLGSEYKNSNNNSNTNNDSSKSLASNRIVAHESESTDTSSDDSSNLTDDPSTAYKFQRRRSRAVLYHLSGRFDHKSKHKLPFKKFQRISGKETIPEYKVQDVQASRFILLHYSLFKIIWDWMILLCTFYIAIMVPYNAAFSQGGDEKDLIICDIIVELLFIIDIILNFWTTYVSKSGQVVYHLKAIAINYLRGWFFLDLLAAIPFDVILAVNNPEIQGTIGEMGNWIHLLKLARLLRLARLFQKIERYSQYSTVILGLLMCMFFLVAHWFACGWYCIGKEEFKSKITREYSWLYELSERMQFNRSYMTVSNNKTNGLTRRALYVSSLYFTTTSLTSVGFGNVSPNTVNEKIFAVITMLIGALMHAAVFGNVTTLIQRMYSRRSAYQTKNQDLKDFTRAHHIPKPLKQRMLEFFQAMWAINRGIDKEAILQSFPENLRGDIALHLNREILSLSLFKSASPGCRKCLAQLITTRFATPGEYLVNQGDVLRFIYFVCSGSLEILGEEGTVVGLLGKCDIFGSDMDDMSMLKFSAYNVKSLTYCELQCIALDQQLQEIFNQYPQFRKQFALAISEELSFNLRAGFDSTSSLELIPAITVTTDKNVHYDDHSNNTTYKCNEVTNNIDMLLNNSKQNKSSEKNNHFNCHDNNNQFITSNYNLITNLNNSNNNQLNQKIIKITENTKNILQKNKFFIKKKQNSLDLYLKHFQTFSDQYNNEIKQMRTVSSIEQLNELNDITYTTYNNDQKQNNNNNNNDVKNNNHLKQNSVVYYIKHKCKSLDTIYQNDKINRIYSMNKLIANFNDTQHEMNIIKLEQLQINEKLDRIHTDFIEFMKYFKKNENFHDQDTLHSNTFKSNNNNNNNTNNSNSITIHNNDNSERLKIIHSITENDIITPNSINTTHNQSSNSCSNINIKNIKDDSSTTKLITSSTMINSRPCLHQYGRTHYSPENRVVTFQLPPRNHDFRSQSLTSSRQISPDTPKSNPFKKLLHKHPSISHEID
ncbi:hypothetical protein MN116_006462 [Schistosoma mekongi]|uniref:Voltage-gated inwardly rectifying potassium channel KCNH3 n=1 Tax=Schistosoma mekongi TaxID=38744 RepID=A0AAE1ZBE8_SCHME|nr:hypothetical protein MN116_006462 [Schistosoma mekongi]